MLVDHLVYAAPDLAIAVADLEHRFGVRAQIGGKHMGLGAQNALLALGPKTYLEIIAPDPEQPEPATPQSLGLDGVTQGKLIAWALACDNLDEAVAEARGYGYDPGEVRDGQRVGPAGIVLRWRMSYNELTEGVVPFLICWGATEHPARSAPCGLTLDVVEIEHPDPLSLRPILIATGANVEVTPATAPALVAHISGPNGTNVLR